MTPIHTDPDPASIEALLERLDPRPAGQCRVPGCVHIHRASDATAPHALAA
jgi:hypothetical protein